MTFLLTLLTMFRLTFLVDAGALVNNILRPTSKDPLYIDLWVRGPEEEWSETIPAWRQLRSTLNLKAHEFERGPVWQGCSQAVRSVPCETPRSRSSNRVSLRRRGPDSCEENSSCHSGALPVRDETMESLR